MLKLNRFSNNPFDHPRIGFDRLHAFTTDHLARLRANDAGGLFAARIAATESAFAAFDAAYVSNDTTLGLRKSRKQSKREFRKALPKSISKVYFAVVARFGEDSPEVAGCFPHGRNIFNKCRDAVMEEELTALLQSVQRLGAALDASVAAGVADLISRWLAVYAESNSASARKATTVRGRRDARAALALELFKNLLAVALNFPGQAEPVKTYMQESLLNYHPRHAAAAVETTAVGPDNAGALAAPN